MINIDDLDSAHWANDWTPAERIAPEVNIKLRVIQLKSCPSSCSFLLSFDINFSLISESFPCTKIFIYLHSSNFVIQFRLESPSIDANFSSSIFQFHSNRFHASAGVPTRPLLGPVETFLSSFFFHFLPENQLVRDENRKLKKCL